jgi:PAS domain S-box-containing protein
MSSISPNLLPPGLDPTSVFASLFEAYPDSLLLVDAKGIIVLANPSAAQLLGYERAELIGLPVDALVPDAIRPRHAAYRHAYEGNPRPRPMGTQMDLVAKRRDGSEVMVEIALSPLMNVGLPYVVSAIRGIGSYPRVKQALQRARYSDYVASLGRLAVDVRDPQRLLEQVPSMATEALQIEVGAVYLLDASHMQFTLASGVGLGQEGEPPATILPNTPDLLLNHVLAGHAPMTVADVRAEHRFSLPQAYLDAQVQSALAMPLSDRGRPVGVLMVGAKTPDRFGTDEIRFVESMGNLLASILQRAQTEEALHHAQRLESVGQLTGGIAHDFNNLLTVIQGNLQVLEDLPSMSANPHAQQLVGAAARASRRGAELTSKLLAFSRRQVLQPGQVDVDKLVHSLADMLRRTLDQRIRIRVEGTVACPPCLADPGQLESALLNIAINARDAMPDGGTLTFGYEPCAMLPSSPHTDGDLSPTGNSAYVAISIGDTGGGMSEEVKERAFEPFFTTKEAGRGTGLGLSTVYGFVKQSHGAVSIDSTPGIGTTVTLYIPQSLDEPPSELSDDTSTSSVPAGLRVLLVEDDPEVRAVVQTFLETLACQVLACTSGEEALTCLDGNTDFALLLTDIALGAGMRGMEVARRVEQRLPGIAVILMSGFSSELLDANRDAPAHWELLQKPYGRAELAQAIARVLATT